MTQQVVENLEAIDGIATLRTFLDEVWSALQIERLTLTEHARLRLDYMRKELLEMQEPEAIADGLYVLGRQLERLDGSSVHVIAFYQFALQCNPHHIEAMQAAVRRFSRLGRWSMVLKLLKVQVGFAETARSAHVLVQMARIYQGFYGSQEGLDFALSRLSADHSDTPLSLSNELWLSLITLGGPHWSLVRLERVVAALNAEDRPFCRAFMRRAIDQSVLMGDLQAMLALSDVQEMGGERSLLLRLRATMIQRRVPEGLDVASLQLNERAKFSIETLNQLLFHKGFFDHVQEPAEAKAWIVGWLMGASVRTSSQIDRALQIVESHAELRPLVHLVSVLESENEATLSPIQRRHLASSSQLLCILKVQNELMSHGRLDELTAQVTSSLEQEGPIEVRRLMQFRLGELDESRSDYHKAAERYQMLWESEPECWIAWSSLVRVKLAVEDGDVFPLLGRAPLTQIDPDSHRTVETWIALEEQRFTSGPVACSMERLVELRSYILGRPSNRVNRRIWPAGASGRQRMSLHVLLAVGWALHDAQTADVRVEDLLTQLSDDQHAYGLALALLLKLDRGDEWVDEQIGVKLPQQMSTFLAVAERLVRCRFQVMSTEGVGDLGFLLTRRFEPAVGHELVSVRAWNMALADGKWTEAITIWRSLLLKGVGCLSAELGLLCGIASETVDKDELGIDLSSVSSLFSNEGFGQICRHWCHCLRPEESVDILTSAETASSYDQILSGLLLSYRTRTPEEQAHLIALLERNGCSEALSISLTEHLAEAQELSGDVLSALRTHLQLFRATRNVHSRQWLLGWLSTNPDLELADLLQDSLKPETDTLLPILDIGHVFWKHQKTAEAIRAFTRGLSNERLRAQALLELGSRLGEHGRVREAGQFYLELVRVTRSSDNRKTLLEQALKWFDSETMLEKTVEVFLLLYQEHAGEYAYISRAKALFVQHEKFHELADYMEKARGLSLASSDQITLELIALYARTLHRPDSARRVCLELQRRSFHLDDAMLRGLAEEMTDLDLWQEASSAYEKLLESTDVHSEAYDGFAYRLASIRQEKLSDLAGARQVLEAILEVRPTAAEALERIALLSCIDGTDSGTARQSLEAAIDVVERGKSRAELLLRLADLEIEHGDEERALKMRNAALSDMPGNLALVGTVVNDLVARGRDKEASAALLKYELLNPSGGTDAVELDRIRTVLKSNGISPYMSREMALQTGEGGGLIVRQLLEQTSELFEGEVHHWLRAISTESELSLRDGEQFVAAAQQRSLLRVTSAPKDVVLEILSWLDSVFSVYPAAEQLALEGAQEALSGTGDRVLVRWTTLPIHTAYFQNNELHISERVREFPDGVRLFIIHYFEALNLLDGLVFTRWAKSELLGLAEEFCRAWFEGGTPTNKDRAQIHEILSQHPLSVFSEALVTTFRQHIQLISSMSEGIVGSALELALFKSGSVHAAFEAMVLLDASLEKYHRGGETLLSELLPRTMLRHQIDYEAMSAEMRDEESY